MKVNQAIQKALVELNAITGMEFQLCDAHRQSVAATKNLMEGQQKSVRAFLDSQVESQEMRGLSFFKVHLREESYALLTEGGESSHIFGKMAVCQLENLLLAYEEREDLNSFLQNLLLDNLLWIDIHNHARKLKIDIEANRGVFVVETKNESDSGVMEIVKSLVDEKDFVTTVDAHNIIMIKHFEGDVKEDAMISVARMLLDMVNAEAMAKVRVGFGGMIKELTDVSKAYKEANLALEVNEIFYGEQPIAAYNQLGIGRIIYQLPMHLCEMFIDETFGGELPAAIDDETLNTIHKFFENNLNVSETARQLFVHRNTLVYRLERIEKATGLDIRLFEDAMTFKIALMVIDYMRHMEKS